MVQSSIAEQIHQLEHSLLRIDIRKSEKELILLIADDFVEIGSSGKVYNKQEAINELLNSELSLIELRDFQTRILASDVVLTTFITSEKSEYSQKDRASLRSSIWKFIDGRWQIVFHQGTPIGNFSYRL